MKTVRYLNSLLTVIAVLLTLNVYLQLAGSSTSLIPGATVAQAADDRAQGVGSTAARQQAIVDELKLLNASVNQLQATLTNGSLKVTVENPAKGE